jgi:hypothetical protein
MDSLRARLPMSSQNLRRFATEALRCQGSGRVGRHRSPGAIESST